MTTKKLINRILLAVAATALLIGCSEFEDTEIVSPLDDNGSGAYISNETATDLVYTPDLDQSFDIMVGRSSGEGAASFSFDIVDADSVFTVPTVTFASGETSVNLTITFDLPIGTSSVLSLKVPDEEVSLYGMDSIGISVSRDYTWVNAGVIAFTSDWAGTTADLDLETTLEDPTLYRILSPYYVLEPDYCPEPGYHIQFHLDEDYNAVSVTPSNIGEEASAGGSWWLDWNTAYDHTFTNDSNSYEIVAYWSSGYTADALTPTYNAVETFIWTEGYPAE